MYLQRNGLFVENSSEGVEQETDIRIVWMSTGEDGGGGSYRHKVTVTTMLKETCTFVAHPRQVSGKKKQAQLRR